jgi:hypothetical protein
MIGREIIVPLGRGQITIEDPHVQKIIADPHPLFGAKVWLYPGVSGPHPYTQDMLNGLARIQHARVLAGNPTNINIGYKPYYVKLAQGQLDADIEWETFPWECMATTSYAGWLDTFTAFTSNGWSWNSSWGDDPGRYFAKVNEGSGADWITKVPLFYAMHSFSAGSTSVAMGPAIIDQSHPAFLDYVGEHMLTMQKTIQARTYAATGHALQFDWQISHKAKQYDWHTARHERPGLSPYWGISPDTGKPEQMPWDNDYTKSQPVDLAPVRPIYQPGSMILIPEFAAGNVNALWGELPEAYQGDGAYAGIVSTLMRRLADAGVWAYVQNWAPWHESEQVDSWLTEEGLRASRGYTSYGGTHEVEGVVIDPEFK